MVASKNRKVLPCEAKGTTGGIRCPSDPNIAVARCGTRRSLEDLPGAFGLSGDSRLEGFFEEAESGLFRVLGGGEERQVAAVVLDMQGGIVDRRGDVA